MRSTAHTPTCTFPKTEHRMRGFVFVRARRCSHASFSLLRPSPTSRSLLSSTRHMAQCKAGRLDLQTTGLASRMPSRQVRNCFLLNASLHTPAYLLRWLHRSERTTLYPTARSPALDCATQLHRVCLDLRTGPSDKEDLHRLRGLPLHGHLAPDKHHITLQSSRHVLDSYDMCLFDVSTTMIRGFSFLNRWRGFHWRK